MSGLKKNNCRRSPGG